VRAGSPLQAPTHVRAPVAVDASQDPARIAHLLANVGSRCSNSATFRALRISSSSHAMVGLEGHRSVKTESTSPGGRGAFSIGPEILFLHTRRGPARPGPALEPPAPPEGPRPEPSPVHQVAFRRFCRRSSVCATGTPPTVGPPAKTDSKPRGGSAPLVCRGTPAHAGLVTHTLATGNSVVRTPGRFSHRVPFPPVTAARLRSLPVGIWVHHAVTPTGPTGRGPRLKKNPPACATQGPTQREPGDDRYSRQSSFRRPSTPPPARGRAPAIAASARLGAGAVGPGARRMPCAGPGAKFTGGGACDQCLTPAWSSGACAGFAGIPLVNASGDAVGRSATAVSSARAAPLSSTANWPGGPRRAQSAPVGVPVINSLRHGVF